MSKQKEPSMQQAPTRLESTRELQRLLLPVQRGALEGMGVDFTALEMRAAAADLAAEPSSEPADYEQMTGRLRGLAKPSLIESLTFYRNVGLGWIKPR